VRAPAWIARFDTLATRIALTLAVGLLLSQVIGFAIVVHERTGWVRDMQLRIYTQRVTELMQFLDGLDQAGLQRLAQSLRAPRIRVLDTADAGLGAPAAMPPRLAAELEAALAARLAPGSLLGVRVSPVSRDAAGDTPLWMPPLGSLRLRESSLEEPSSLTIGTADRARRVGTDPAWFEDRPPEPPMEEPRSFQRIRIEGVTASKVVYELEFLTPAALAPRVPPGVVQYFLITGFVLLALAMIASRLVVRPLRRLADAAERLGRDLLCAPLTETGPREVVVAARRFNDMQQRLLRFVQGRADALSAMSHDLRTPITRVRLRAEMLPEREREGLVRDVADIDQMIEYTLNFMRGIDDQEEVQSVDARLILQEVVVRSQDLGASVALIDGPSLRARLRPMLLRRALGNLIENACKYGEQVQVSVFQDRGNLVFSVRDRGPGVPEAVLPLLVRPFYRVEASRNRATGGSGLGLAIVKDIAERHGGRLILGNRQGGGFVAELQLPLH